MRGKEGKGQWRRRREEQVDDDLEEGAKIAGVAEEEEVWKWGCSEVAGGAVCRREREGENMRMTTAESWMQRETHR